MKQLSITIDAVAVSESGTDEALAAVQTVGAALKNNGVFSVENVSVTVLPETD